MTNIHCEEAHAVLAEQFRSSLKAFIRDVRKLDGGRRLIKQSGIKERFETVERLRVKKLARRLFDYMQYRMDLEQEYMQPGSYPDEADCFHFYYEFLLAGGREIFGVEIGDHELIGDFENATAFRAWRAKIINQSQITSNAGAAAADDVKLHSAPVRAKTSGVRLRLVGEGRDASDEADGSARGGTGGSREKD